MGAISGDVNSLYMQCADASDLASRPIAGLRSGDQAYLFDRVGSFEGPLFYLDKASVEVVDGVGVLAASGSVGRWLSVALYNGAEVPVSAATAAALALVPTDSFRVGAPAWVNSFRARFRLDPTSVLAPDNKTVIAAQGGGNWLRDPSYSDPTWGLQSVWAVDTALGNDENTGAPGSPIRTFAELRRRYVGLSAAFAWVVTTTGNVPANDQFVFDDLPSGATVEVRGTPTVAGAGVVSAFQAIARAANQALEIEAVALGGTWTALGYVEKMIRVTRGATVAVAFVLQDLGGGNNRARLSPLLNVVSWAQFVPQIGDTFEVLDLPTIGTHPSIAFEADVANVTFYYFNFTDPTYDYAYGKVLAGSTTFFGCRVSDYLQMTGASNTRFFASGFFSDDANTYRSLPEMYLNARASFSACGFNDANAYVALYSPAADLYVTNDTIFTSGSVVYAPRGGEVRLENVASFDSNFDTFIALSSANLRVTGAIYGTGNTNNIVYLGSFVRGTYTNAALLTATSTVPVLDFGAVTKAWADLPFVNSNDAAFPVPAGNQSGLVLNT
jgi:hypothetical protein